MRKSKLANLCIYSALGIILLTVLVFIINRETMDITLNIISKAFIPVMILSAAIFIASIVSLVRIATSKRQLKGLIKSIVALILSILICIGAFIMGIFASAIESTNEALGSIDNMASEDEGDESDKPSYTIPEFVEKDFDVVAAAKYKEPDSTKYVAGYIDKTGVFVIEPKFDDVKDFCEGLAPVEMDNKWGYIDKTGEFVIPPQFDNADIFSSGVAAVKVNDMWGYIDKNGDYIIEPSLEKAVRFTEGLAPMVSPDNGKIGFIDTTGKYVIEPKYDGSNTFSEGYAFVVKDLENDIFGIVDKQGNYLEIRDIYLGYDYNFSNGLLRAYKKGESEGWGFIDTTGEFVIEPIYSTCGSFSEGLGEVSFGGFKAGFIDTEGNMVIEPNYYGCKPFSEGLAVAQREFDLGTPVGFIDKTGNFVIEPKFYSARSFSEGLALVYEDGVGYGFIDKTGEYVIEPITVSAEFGRFHKIDRVYDFNKADSEERKID